MKQVPLKEFLNKEQWKQSHRFHFLHKFNKNRLAVFGTYALLLILVAAIFAEYVTSYSPFTQDLLHRLQAPSLLHPLGTDEYGRDVLSRILYGARVSLLVSLTSVGGAIVIGSLIGALAGYYGGWVDSLLMRLVDLLNAFPVIFLLITIVTLVEPTLLNLVLVFVFLGWMGTARLVRGEILRLKGEEFIWAAKSVGMSDARIIFYHLLPNAAAPIIVAATLGVGNVILAESGLSFLGLGIQPPLASWGNMLQAAQSLSVMVTAPWYPFFPGLLIFVTVLAFNFLGDGLRDALDPKQDGR